MKIFSKPAIVALVLTLVFCISLVLTAAIIDHDIYKESLSTPSVYSAQSSAMVSSDS